MLSALIQNFDTVEKVIETSANSAGSALKENERYLDSIQGKIDQFNNAMQAMWSDTLDSDMVKWFVGLGTELIKIVDAIGLIPSILAAILTYKLAIGAIKMFDLTSLGTYIGMLFTANNVTEVQGLLINKNALAQKLLNSTLIQAQAARMGLTAADLAGYSVTQLLTLGVKGLAAGFKNLWIAMGPVGWAILAIVAAATIFTVVFNAVNKTTEELTEELNELKTELQDIQSEIETVNSELETMEERMAELLAKDSLSFVEQEELDRLQKENNELQRRLDLLEAEEKIKQNKAAETFVQTMESYGDKAYKRGGEMNWWQRLWSGDSTYAESQDEYIKKLMSEYDKVLKVDSGELDRSVLVDEMGADWYSEKIGAEVQALVDAANGLDYFEGDNLTDKQKEVNEWLDYVYNTQDKLAIMRNGENAKTNSINRIFDKDENAEISDSIDEYVEALRKGDTSAKTSIENIIKNNHALVEDLEASGLSVGEAVDYFTSFASELEFATLEGKIAEMQNATSKMQTLLSNTKSADFTGLFDEDGEVSSTAISEYFQGTSEATREEIAKLVKDINDGEISVENALKQFEIFSIQSSLDIYIAEVQTNFKDVFVDLEDADGLISTFEELGEAIGSAASALDTLNQAQAEMAYSGHVSMETALQLMEYTDDYGSVLQVVDGKLQLVEGAENNLIQARINAIKTSAEASLSDATNAYNKAVLATQEYKSALTTDMSAEVVAKSWEKVLAAGAGLWEGIKSLITDESWSDAYNRGYNDTLSSITGYETEYNDSGLQALADAEAEAKALMEQAQDRVELANQLTPETLESINSSKAASGGADDPEEAAENAFQREMDYWENRIAANQSKYEQLQNEIDLLEAKGQRVDASFYEDQLRLTEERRKLLEGEDGKGGQKGAALAYLKELEAAGKEGSEEWWEVANTLNDIESELDDVTASIVDLQDAIGEIDTYKFEEFNTRLDDITSKLGTIRDLIAPNGEEDWFDDEGNWTEEGVAVLGTHIQELETYKQGLAEAEDAYADYVKEYAGNEKQYAKLGIHSEQELYDKRQELIEQQYDYLESIGDTERSIVDMYESSVDAIEEYTETLIDSYNDYIDSVKEALEAERDLYDFKKNVQKQSKDIATIERRIASLSGSTNASDVAERRKLEAELYESRESLNDTYYDHARSAQDEALDAEQTAYEETMTAMVEGVRTSLEESTRNMDEFLMGVTSMVMYNADTILNKYEETNLPLTKELTNPWEEAKKAVGTYSGDAIALMNKWTEKGGFFEQFNVTGTTNLKSPWSAGTSAANTFKTSVSTVMSDVVSNISTNVKTASDELSKLYQQIKDTEQKAVSANVTPYGGSGGGGGGGGGYVESKSVPSGPDVTNLQKILNKFFSLRDGDITGRYDNATFAAVRDMQKKLGITVSGKFDAATKKALEKYLNSQPVGSWFRSTGTYIPGAMYAKGTTGTTRDEWAITDEPQFGDELTMYATPEGTLSFMRAGSTVIPADITANLVEWGKLNPDMLNVNGTPNINMINNAVNKPELNITFDSLVKAENITEETLPAVRKLVTQELNRFTKELNYALKGKGAR